MALLKEDILMCTESLLESCIKEYQQNVQLNNKVVSGPKAYYASVSALGNIKYSEYLTNSGVLIIPIKGAMQREDDEWFEVTSTDKVRALLKEAALNPKVLGAVLDVSSGGGTVSGTYELAQEIESFPKPIVSIYTDLGASAAVWAGSAADEVYAANPTTFVGSIGTLLPHVSMAKMYQAYGLDINLITSRGSEDKVLGNPYEPLSDRAKEYLKDRLDSINKEFTSYISKKRKDINEEAAFSARIFSAKDAKKIGLIDGIMSFDSAVSRVIKLSKESNKNKNTVKMEIQNKGPLSAYLPEEKAKKYTEDVTFSAQEANALLDTLDSFSSKITELTADLNAKSESISLLEAKYRNSEEVNDEFRAKYEESLTVVDELVAKVAALELQKEEATLMPPIPAVEEDEKFIQMKSDVDKLELKVLELEEKLEETLAENLNLDAKVSNLYTELQNEKADKQSIVAKYNELSANISGTGRRVTLVNTDETPKAVDKRSLDYYLNNRKLNIVNSAITKK